PITVCSTLSLHDALPIWLGITVGLTVTCYLFALLLGFFWTFLRRVPSRPFHWFVTWAMEFIRSTPPLVQLFFIYYAWPMIPGVGDRKSTRLNSSHVKISY